MKLRRSTNSPITKVNGVAVWEQKEGDKYLCTGKDIKGNRFAIRSDSWKQIEAINVWQGSKWLLRDGGKYLIMRITN